MADEFGFIRERIKVRGVRTLAYHMARWLVPLVLIAMIIRGRCGPQFAVTLNTEP
jgi:hypothetical protein